MMYAKRRSFFLIDVRYHPPLFQHRIRGSLAMLTVLLGPSLSMAQEVIPWVEYLANPGAFDVTVQAQKEQMNFATMFRVTQNWTPDYNFRYAFTPNDPYVPVDAPDTGLPGQWHLQNNTSVSPPTDANLIGAWSRDVTGQGVTIGIVDDSLQRMHPDLSPNYRVADSFDFGQKDDDPSPVHPGDNHGTSVAGVAAARGGNAIGGTGAAPMAGLAGLRIDFVDQLPAMFVDATRFHSDGIGAAGSNIHVKNHSYGVSTPFVESQPQASAIIASHDNGTIHVFAAGNERMAHGTFLDVNGNGMFDPDRDFAVDGDANKKQSQSLQETIAVAALGNDGVFSSYSNSGANVFVTAPSSDSPGFSILTTDRTGASGYNSLASAADGDSISDLDYTSTFGGTSSASPLVAGIMALGKQVSSNMNTRLAKHLMVMTNVKVDPSDATTTGGGDGVTPGSAWITNAAGHAFNQNYGFGLIDADAFTLAAIDFSGVTPLMTETTGRVPVTEAIPDMGSVGRAFTLSQSGALEDVEVTLDISHTWRGDLEATLTSPSGTTSRLMRSNIADSFNVIDWTLVSNAFWGEDPAGDWLLTVTDTVASDSGIWNSYSSVMRTGTLILVGDCNGDGLVDAADLECACAAGVVVDVLAAMGMIEGDFDGNGEVAFADFLVLSANFGQTVGSYTQGDVNCDGTVGLDDFLVLSANFGTSRSHVAAVPEPGAIVLFLMAGAVLLDLRRCIASPNCGNECA